MPEAWEPEQGSEIWSDRDAWRGDADAGDNGDTEVWRAELDAGSVWDDEEECVDETETEADDITLDDWPEDCAGPEYWLYKRYGI